MKTLTVEKANWTGEKGEIRILNDGRFFVEGLDGAFRLEERTVNGETVFDVIDQFDDRYRGWQFTDWNTRKPYVTFTEFNCQRSHPNPYAAFAQLAWNIF